MEPLPSGPAAASLEAEGPPEPASAPVPTGEEATAAGQGGPVPPSPGTCGAEAGVEAAGGASEQQQPGALASTTQVAAAAAVELDAGINAVRRRIMEIRGALIASPRLSPRVTLSRRSCSEGHGGLPQVRGSRAVSIGDGERMQPKVLRWADSPLGKQAALQLPSDYELPVSRHLRIPGQPEWLGAPFPQQHEETVEAEEEERGPVVAANPLEEDAQPMTPPPVQWEAASPQGRGCWGAGREHLPTALHAVAVPSPTKEPTCCIGRADGRVQELLGCVDTALAKIQQVWPELRLCVGACKAAATFEGLHAEMQHALANLREALQVAGSPCTLAQEERLVSWQGKVRVAEVEAAQGCVRCPGKARCDARPPSLDLCSPKATAADPHIGLIVKEFKSIKQSLRAREEQKVEDSACLRRIEACLKQIASNGRSPSSPKSSVSSLSAMYLDLCKESREAKARLGELEDTVAMINARTANLGNGTGAGTRSPAACDGFAAAPECFEAPTCPETRGTISFPFGKQNPKRGRRRVAL